MFISSEIEEVVRLSDRIVVMKDHQKIAEIDGGPDVSADAIVSIIAEESSDGGGEREISREEVTS